MSASRPNYVITFFLFAGLLLTASPTTNTTAANTQDAATIKQMLVDRSPWKGSWEGGKGEQKIRLRFFLGKDGEFTATFNSQPASDTKNLKVDGKKVTLKARKKRGKILEFSLTLDDAINLSGNVAFSGKAGWKVRPVVLKPAH